MFDGKTKDIVKELNTCKETLITLVPEPIARKHSLEEIVTAVLEAYALIHHGLGRARQKGLEALSILCRERNIGKTAQRCGAKPGEVVVTVVASTDQDRAREIIQALSTETCSLAERKRGTITRIATYPIKERLFKIRAE